MQFDPRFSAINASDIEKIGLQLAITQDKRGFMWFGGDNGLARYDGYEVKLYRHSPEQPNSLSFNQIQDLFQDSQGHLWVATTYGVNIYDESTDGFVKYFPESASNGKLHNRINSIIEGPVGYIWIATAQGLSKIKLIDSNVVNQEIELPEEIRAGGDSVLNLFRTRSGAIWASTRNNGIYIIDLDTQAVHSFKDPDNLTRLSSIFSMKEDSSGRIWMATADNGLLRFDPQTNELKQYSHTPTAPSSLHHNTVWRLYIDRSENLWVATDDSLDLYVPATDSFVHFPKLTGTGWYGKVRSIFQNKAGDLWFGMFPSGTAFLDIDATTFRHFRSEESSNSLSHNAVSAIVEDAEGNFWIGTEEGLNYFDVKANTFKRYKNKYDDPYSLPNNSVLSLLIDRNGILWVGTWKGGWANFDPKTQRFTKARVPGSDGRHMNEIIWALYEDSSGRIWAGGLYMSEPGENTFRHYKDIYSNPDTLNSELVKSIYEDRLGNFWIGTSEGIYRFDRSDGSIVNYNYSKEGKNGLEDDNIFTITEDQEGNLLFGTMNGGVAQYDRQRDRFNRFSFSNGSKIENITGIVDDRNGSLWMIGSEGLVHYNKSNKSTEVFDRHKGLQGDLFHRNAIIRSKRGDIVFGGAHGLTVLNPDDLTENLRIPPVVITQLDVYNKMVSSNTDIDILDKPITIADRFKLTHDQNFFTVTFSALNYRLPLNNLYSYKLEGFDQSWIEAGRSRRATYTNLDPGEYTLRVRGSNNSGHWNEQGTSIQVVIQPPWWQTPTAYIAYIVLSSIFLGCIFLVLHRLREAKNAQLINSRLRQVDQLKDAFLANTSHELRTPLNGIIGLTQWVISETERLIPAEALKKLKLVVTSGQRLSNIVNDILDFSKLKGHEIELIKENIDLYDLVDSAVCLSEVFARDKGIKVINGLDRNFPYFIADRQRLSQVLDNLVGNALKFTERGTVTINASSTEEWINISVIDTGVGISEDDLERIFLPFEQAVLEKDAKTVGTGLGLAVSKQLVELHGGSLRAKSRKGSGSVFTVSLPYSQLNEPVKPKTTLAYQHIQKEPSFQQFKFVKSQPDQVLDESISDSHILIVDDEPVNRIVLDGYLKKYFKNVSECATGRDALKLIETNNHYDLILLDVMMPGLSGYETCREIRKTHNQIDLPILFLTAKSQSEDLAEGYHCGANDFLFKPVNHDEFILKVLMHLKSKALYQSHSVSSTLNQKFHSQN